jgi:glycosyltransferase involved in cell wall biosynthesis
MNSILPKLAVIGTVGVPAKYGGFETLAHYLVKNLNKKLDITVYCSEKSYSEEERIPTWNGAKLHYIPLKANGLQSILYDLLSMIHALRNSDILLILGVSGCIFLPFIKIFSKKKIIVNVDGLEWRRQKWNWFAKKFLLFSEQIACKYADEIVTDNRILKEYVKIRYNIEGNLIEYGADHTFSVDIQSKDLEKYPFLASEYAFKVARIEPENNLHLILKVFSQIPAQKLVIVGNWRNSAYGRNLKAEYSTYENIEILDPIYELEALNLLRSNAKFYVHGHSAGGTNPSLVEAMYLQLPVIAFDVIYNRITANNQSLFFHDLVSLKEIVANIDHYPLRAIARDMKTCANRRYTWASIASRYANLVEGRKYFETPVLSTKSVSKELAKKALQKPILNLPDVDGLKAKGQMEKVEV